MSGLPPERCRFRRLAALVFLVAVLTRAAPLPFHRLEPPRITTVDSARYLELADRLAAGRGFTHSDPLTAEAVPELFRTPGYPLALALASRLPGSRDAWMLGLQILADALAAVLCAALATGWASRRAGAFAAAFFVVDPAHVVYSNLLMADVFCGLAITAAFVVIATVAKGDPGGRRSGGRRSAAGLAAAGALLSMATALRPVAALLFLPAAIFLHRRRTGWRALAAFLAAALLFPLGWTARNAAVAGTWSLSTAFDVNLALVAAARVEARIHRLPRSVAQERVMARVAERSDLPWARACREVALDTLLQAPRATLIEGAAGVVEMALAGERRYLRQVFGGEVAGAGVAESRRQGLVPGRRLAGYGAADRFLILGQSAFMVGVWALAALGVASLWRHGRRDEALLAVLALAVVLGPSWVVATGRLRVPVTFLIAGLAGVGADAGLRRARARRGAVGAYAG